jgi:type 1 glutamine amidotransferase
MTDETYTMSDPGPDSEILLSVHHPKSMKHLAWTRQFRNSRVFNLQSGHDNLTWVDPNFRQVLERGLAWCAGRI